MCFFFRDKHKFIHFLFSHSSASSQLWDTRTPATTATAVPTINRILGCTIYHTSLSQMIDFELPTSQSLVVLFWAKLHHLRHGFGCYAIIIYHGFIDPNRSKRWFVYFALVWRRAKNDLQESSIAGGFKAFEKQSRGDCSTWNICKHHLDNVLATLLMVDVSQLTKPHHLA